MINHKFLHAEGVSAISLRSSEATKIATTNAPSTMIGKGVRNAHQAGNNVFWDRINTSKNMHKMQ